MIQAIIGLAFFGFVMIYLEFFVPGMVMAIAGGICLLSSIIMMFISGYAPLWIVAYTLGIILMTIMVVKYAVKHLRKRKHSFFLEADQSGYVATTFNKEIIGEFGVASTDLRPSGYIFIDNEYIQATSYDGFIEKGNQIKVIKGEGGKVFVIKKVCEV